MKRILFFSAAFIFILQGCSVDNLPEERPKDMVIVYSENGGMLDVGKSVFLSIDSSYVVFRNYGTDNKVYMKFNKGDLDNLYSVFRKNNFPNIGVHTEDDVYDRGGTTISISFGGETIRKSDNSNSFIDESSQKLYSEVEGAINNLVDDFLEKMKRNFKIELDTTLIGDNKYLQFKYNEDYRYNSEKEGRRDSILLNILDGPGVFFLTLNEKDPSGSKYIQKASKQIPIDINGLMSGAIFYYEDNDIKWSPRNIDFN